MTREEIIRNLKYTMEKHKNDTVDTFDTNISLMCKDILDYLEQEPCEDAISRQTTINYLCKNMCWYDIDGNMADDDEQEKAITDLINGIPPVQPIRPKGRWIGSAMLGTLRCSRCYGDCPMNGDFYNKTDFFPDCGADMRGEENGKK